LLKKTCEKVLALKQGRERSFYYLSYSIIWAIVCIAIFSIFYLNGKSFLFREDGLMQHANTLAYWGRYLRQIIYNIIENHTFEIPMWDLGIGYGADIFATFSYYVIGDPLNLLAVMVPIRHTELLYTFLVLLRIYLTGISFSAYSRYHKNPAYPTLIGALAYCLCGYALYGGLKHPFFLNPMVYLPLLLLGIDKIFCKEKPYLFLIMTGISALSNFYFFYMLSIFIFIYAVFRYIMLFKRIRRKELVPWLLKFIGYYAVGLSMSCILFLPIIINLFSTGRIEIDNYVPVLYTFKYYGQLFTNFISGGNLGFTTLGYAPTVLIAVILIFLKKSTTKNNRRYYKYGFILLTLFLLIPYFGHVLNGFSYVSNRWHWAYSMLLSYILVKMVPEIRGLVKKDQIKLLLIVAAYALICLLDINKNRSNAMGSLVILMITVVLLVYMSNERASQRAICTAVLISTCVGLVWNARGTYAISENDYLSERYYDRGSFVSEMLSNTESKLVKSVEDNSIFRYDQLQTKAILNTTLHQPLYSTNYFFSMANGYIGDYFKELYLNNTVEQKYCDLDGRTILDSLASVKYFMVIKGKDNLVPYDYTEKPIENKRGGETGITNKLYENNNPLPLGYTYDSYIECDEYEKMTPTQKQQALLQGCVLEESNFNKLNPEFTDQKVDYEVTASDSGIVMEGDQIQVLKKNASITLDFAGEVNSETYVVIDNLDYQDISPRDKYTKESWDRLSAIKRNIIKRNTRFWKAGNEYSLKITSGGITKGINGKTNENNFYNGVHNYLVNMGYSEEAKGEIEISFPYVGTYTFDQLTVICQPMDNYIQQVDKCKEDVLENITVITNGIQGSIALDQPKILTFSIPYINGFRVFVNGEERELKRANTMYMAVELGAGGHEIVLKYDPPNYKIGAILTLMGILALAAIVIYEKRKAKLSMKT